MKCDICNKKMIYFKESLTCGWKCDSCGNMIVTTYDDGLDTDDSIYSILISPGNSTAAKNIKCIAKILSCSFIDAKEVLLNGKEINNLNAVNTRDFLKELQATDIIFTTTPAFKYSID